MESDFNQRSAKIKGDPKLSSWMVGFASTIGVPFMLLRHRPRRTVAGIVINTHSASHVMSGRTTKSTYAFEELQMRPAGRLRLWS